MKYHLVLEILVTACAAVPATALAQQSFREQFLSHNAEMTKLQPAFITPLVAPDPRLMQYVRFSVSHEYTASHAETVSYGNLRGGGLIARRRFEFDWMPPAYIVHNSTAKDGASDTCVLGKYRIASGNAQHGNYIVSAMVTKSFASGSHANGGATGVFTPAFAGGYAFRRYDFISSLGGTLPTGQIAKQGRSIAWSALVQAHATPHVWLELEDNATFYRGGQHDGQTQNFVTPGVFYVFRRKEWKPAHPFVIVDGGMQIASSAYHSYNHNLITEARLLF